MVIGDPLIGDFGITLKESEQEGGVRRESSTTKKHMSSENLQKNNGSTKSPKLQRKIAIFTFAIISSLIGINTLSSVAHAGNGYYPVYGADGSHQSCKAYHWGVSCY